MKVQVKICGVNSVEAADATITAGADFAGLIFHPHSPRHLSAERAKTIATHLRGRARIVAVFADAGDAEMVAVIAGVKPDLIQLHGSENVERVAHLKSRFRLPVIKAIAVADASDLAAARAFEQVADFFLFDAKAPQGVNRTGGHGIAFDWNLLSNSAFPHPWFLSGGLNTQNVAQAIAASRATMVDVSSGVEDAPGKKSPEKIKAFIRAAREASAVKGAA